MTVNLRDEEILLRCSCDGNEHHAMLTFDKDEWYLTVHLDPHILRQRFWRAVKYVCGHRSRYGDFTEIVLTNDDMDMLVSFIRRHRHGTQDN